MVPGLINTAAEGCHQRSYFLHLFSLESSVFGVVLKLAPLMVTGWLPLFQALHSDVVRSLRRRGTDFTCASLIREDPSL